MEQRSPNSQSELRNEKFSQIVDRSRKRTESDFSNDDPPINAAREYQCTMKALRHGNKAKIPEPSVSVIKIWDYIENVTFSWTYKL